MKTVTSTGLVRRWPPSASITGELGLQDRGYWAYSWAHGIGWAHPTPYHWVTVIGSVRVIGSVGSWDSSVAYQNHPWVWDSSVAHQNHPWVWQVGSERGFISSRFANLGGYEQGCCCPPFHLQGQSVLRS